MLLALGSIYTNKYSEGYPGKRYYGGQEFTDRRKILLSIGLSSYSGPITPDVHANIAVYQAWLKPGDTVMAMALDEGDI